MTIYDLQFANGMFMHVPLVSGMGQTGRLDQIGDSFTDNIKFSIDKATLTMMIDRNTATDLI